MVDITTEKNRRKQELILHRCAIFGSGGHHAGYDVVLKYLKNYIVQSITDGFYTFITFANDGYELDAARFILDLKRTKTYIRLVIVVPTLNKNRNWNTVKLFEEVCKEADLVKVISKTNDPDASNNAIKWILSNCKRIITATNSPNFGINRLSEHDLSGIECIKVSVQWQARIEVIPNNPKEDSVTHKHQGLKFPYNFLVELLGSERINECQFPDDVKGRLFGILSKYDERIQQIIILRYSNKLKLQQIGDRFGISRERVRQIIEKCLRKLRYETHMDTLLGLDNKNDAKSSPQIIDNKKILTVNDEADSVEVKDGTNSSGKWKRWTEDEEERLLSLYENGISIAEIAEIHKRTTGGIVARLSRLTGVDGDSIRKSEVLKQTLATNGETDDIKVKDETDSSSKRKKWTEDEEKQLLSLYKSGTSIVEIADMNKRTVGSVISRLSKLVGVEAVLPSTVTMSISAMASLLSWKTKKLYGLTLRYSDIAKWLVASGDLFNDYSSEKAIKMPTPQGQKHGIMRGERINSVGLPYVGVYLEPTGQQYIVENLNSILQFIVQNN